MLKLLSFFEIRDKFLRLLNILQHNLQPLSIRRTHLLLQKLNDLPFRILEHRIRLLLSPHQPFCE